MITALFVTITAAISYYIGNRRAYRHYHHNANEYIRNNYWYLDRMERRDIVHKIIGTKRPLI